MFGESPGGKRNDSMIVTLNGAHEVIRVKVLTIGLINRTVIHPREFFRQAIKDNSAAVIAIHNHPSGNLHPSEEDREITARLKDAGEILGVVLLDHIIVSKEGYYSFVEHGLMDPDVRPAAGAESGWIKPGR